MNRLKQAVHAAVNATPIGDRLGIIRDQVNAGFLYADYVRREFRAESTYVISVRASDCFLGACVMRRATDRAAWPYGQQLWDEIYGGLQ